MGKSLKERVKEGSEKDKDLVDVLREIEESYIYKGLDFIDRKLRLSEYYPNSKITKGFDAVKDFMFYSNILGCLPTEKQEKYTKHLGYDKLLFTKYSFMYLFPLCAAKLIVASTLPPPASTGMYTWGLIFLTEDCLRLTYMLAKKRPIGSLVYAEIPYRAIKPAFKYVSSLFKKKDENLEEVTTMSTKSNDLNTEKNLTLS